ncbi:MAG TPA: CPBP family intramembrane glutamic endopeptidase, partial [Phycisphaerales bacterium]|nr:CPBP family intramembrane glutamic endopeptidase [Phycisphaerales bacterium]
LGGAAAEQFAVGDGHPADRLQAAPIFGEVEGAGAALDWLYVVRARLDVESLSGPSGLEGDWRQKVAAAREAAAGTPGSEWAAVGKDPPKLDEQALADAQALEALYTEGSGALSAEARARLIDRYGWLGELALAHDLPEDAPEREALFHAWPWALLLIAVVSAVFTLGAIGGLVMAVLALVFFFTGSLRPRFVPPRAGGSVYLETFAAFLGLFLVVHLIGGLLAELASKGKLPLSETAVTVGVLVAQWLLLPVLLWPLVRGVPAGRWRESVGWHAPRGFAREIGAGVLGYFAGLPIFFLGILLTLGLTALAERISGEPVTPPTNPVLELISSGSALVVVLFVLLATVWAPIMEETIFRGGLYRHMRGRVGVAPAALLTALLFAFLHSYGPLMTGPLIALGFTFALIREWRGSLVASMTAHCLHNATVTTISLIALRALA